PPTAAHRRPWAAWGGRRVGTRVAAIAPPDRRRTRRGPRGTAPEVAVAQTLGPEILLDSGGRRVCILRIDLYLLPSPARRGHFLDREGAGWTGRAEMPTLARPHPR